jgi:nucleotide-binding universal stress UspA family protein
VNEQSEVIRARGIEVTAEVRDGSPAAEILAFTVPGDLVVMTTHGRGGIRRWLLGSVAEKIVRTASVPVLLIRAAEQADR